MSISVPLVSVPLVAVCEARVRKDTHTKIMCHIMLCSCGEPRPLHLVRKGAVHSRPHHAQAVWGVSVRKETHADIMCHIKRRPTSCREHRGLAVARGAPECQRSGSPRQSAGVETSRICCFSSAAPTCPSSRSQASGLRVIRGRNSRQPRGPRLKDPLIGAPNLRPITRLRACRVYNLQHGSRH